MRLLVVWLAVVNHINSIKIPPFGLRWWSVSRQENLQGVSKGSRPGSILRCIEVLETARTSICKTVHKAKYAYIRFHWVHLTICHNIRLSVFPGLAGLWCFGMCLAPTSTLAVYCGVRWQSISLGMTCPHSEESDARAFIATHCYQANVVAYQTPTGKRQSNSVFYLSSSWRFGNMPSWSKFSKQSPDLPQCVCNLCSAQFSQYTRVASWENPSTSCHFMLETNIRLVLWATLPMKQSLVPCCAAVMDRSSKIMDSYNIPSYTKREFYHQQALLESWPGHTFARRQCVS